MTVYRVQMEVRASDSESAFEESYWKMRREYLRPGTEDVLVIPLDEGDETDASQEEVS